jgi:hypothetical protein
MQMLDSREDMDWLAEVHTPLAKDYQCAFLHGNEDCPDRIELFKLNDCRCKPTILHLQDDGSYALVQTGDGSPPSMTPRQILKALEAGQTVTYIVRRRRGVISGDAAFVFKPEDASIGVINIAHKLKCFRFDEKPYDQPRWIVG